MAATSWTNPTPGSLEGVWGQPLNDILDAILDALQRLEIPLGLVATDDATAVAGRLPNIAAMRRLVLAPDEDEGGLLLRDAGGDEIVNMLLALDQVGAPIAWIANAGGFGLNDRLSLYRGILSPPTQQWDIYGYERRNGRASFVWPGPPGNLLSFEDAVQEIYEGLRSGTIGSWQMIAGGTLALVAEAPGVQTPSGGFSSLRLTATGTSMQASTAVGVAAYPVTAGQQYSVVGHTLAMDTARSPQWGIRWYNAAGTYLSQGLGTATAQPDVDTWTLGYGAGLTAPAGAAWAAPTPVFGTTAVGERHRVAGVALFPGTVTLWSPPFVGSGTYAVWGEAAPGDTWEDSAGRQRYVCTTGGIPAAQVWTPAASGVELSADAPLALGTADPGATGEAADAGHVHPTTGLLLTTALSSSTPAPVGTSGSAGVSTNVARADHVHAAGGGLGLAAWRQGLANRLYGGVNVVAIGSSTTAGNNATALGRRYVNQLGADLHLKYNAAAVAGGAHILGVDSGWTFTGTHGTDTNGLGLQSVTLATSATMTRTENPCTGFDVYYAQGPGAGAFTVSIDGATAVTVTPDTNGTAARHDGVYSSPTVTSGSHSILITASAATVINSVYARGGDESAGVRLYNSGLAGANAGSFYFASAAFYQRLAALNPRLVLVMLGANDFSGQTALATFSTQMQGIVDRIVGAVTPTPSILMVGTYRRLDVTGVPTISWQQYLDAMAAVAAANPGVVEYVDISASYPTTQEADQSSLVIDPTDYIHQGDRGHRLMSDLLTAQLTAPAAPVATMPAFDPRAVGGLLAWLDAGTLGLGNNVAVSSWSPRAGIETAALAQATSGNQPVFRTNRVNGRPSVAFTAASSHNLDSGTWAGKRSTPLTVVTIARFNTGNLGNAYSGRSGVYAYAGISTGTTLAVGAGAVAEVTQSTTMDTWHVILTVYNGASSAIYVDSHTATATGTTTTGSNSALPGLRLGTNSGASGNFLDGEIAEVAVYGRALTAAEITALTRWYGTRYGITVA